MGLSRLVAAAWRIALIGLLDGESVIMPTIISDGGGTAATISLAEDRRGVTRVVATDPNPVAISYTIVAPTFRQP